MGRLHRNKPVTTERYLKQYLRDKGFVPSNYAIGTRVVTA